MDLLPNRKMTRNTSNFINLIDLVVNPQTYTFCWNSIHNGKGNGKRKMQK